MIETISFTKRYITALSIIALLSILAYYNLNHLISSQSNDGKIINISSKQGMLSQQIALYAIYYKTENLRTNIILMEESHNLLISFPMSKELKKIYFEEPFFLDKNVRTYLYHAKRFEENRDGRSLTYILQNSQKLLDNLDLATSIYVATTESNTIKLKNVEFFIFIFTLVTLFFEAIFIFKPATKRITEVTKELIKQHDYANTIIESNTNAIVTLDATLKIQTYNHMAEKIFGYTKEEIIGEPFFQKIILKESLPVEQEGILNFKKILEIENKEEVREIKAINKKGHTFPIRISFGISGEEKNMLIISMQDISKEILKDKIMIQQAKFAALGEMIAIIAHQWRQPLAQLSFNCMYIKKKLTDPELMEETAKNEEIIQFMSETITNFENFYKHVDNTIFNPTISINQTLLLLESSLKLYQIKLIQKFDSKMKIFGNSNSLSQVILSILQNTIDIIKISEIEDPFIHITLEDSDKFVVLKIADNAGGIQTPLINDIFKPFHSNKNKLSTGIGLYMSKLIIENQFHGIITAKNINNGAQFSILLPSCCDNM
ncbi:PAS domain S-box protein [Sulfurospirillum halorespirans]|uniref:histidine kinase n=1 Tax=Sulfurospirillum halorespirans DSM 13726 TaxID=1193502 RepID=A0A1D7TGM1_9BACT|nr:PAS domain S-box protein [Sulfurospirillum halorespirans]AOO64155.1 putative histidine kinase [Sulfurospirillum halorespirans DSM 13726]